MLFGYIRLFRIIPQCSNIFLQLVFDYGKLFQRRFLLQKMTSTLDVYLSLPVDGNFHFKKEFFRLYTGLISASCEGARNVARMSFNN